MQINLSNTEWTATCPVPHTIKLQTSHPRTRHWYCLQVLFFDQNGPHFITPVSLRKGSAWQHSNLLKNVQTGEMELLFFSGNTLETLQIDLPTAVVEQQAIHIDIKPISTLSAIAGMIRAVSSRDRDKQIDATRIFRKSWARWRKHGYAEFLIRLVREYHPLEIASLDPPDIYTKWIEAVEQPEIANRQQINDTIAKLTQKPRISVMMSVYNAPEKHLHRAVKSLIDQSYPEWELCIVDDASAAPHVRPSLTSYSESDSRIKIKFHEQHSGIAAAMNSALALGRGNFVANLEQDGALSEHTLYFVAQAINEHPHAQIIYSDEDQIDDEGCRANPHFKSDWNPDLFFSQNYISHFTVYRRDLVATVMGFRSGMDDCPDYDLMLRCLSHVEPREIIHIPKVLYHGTNNQNTERLETRAQTDAAATTAIDDYFQSQGRTGISVEPGLVPNTYRVRYPIPNPAPLVTLLIPTRDKRELIETCVTSILQKTTYRNFEILILDNQSREVDTLDYFARIQHDDVRVRVLRYDHPFNYSAINNFGARHANGEILGLINNDIEVITPEWLTEMVSHASRPEIGCVGAKLYYDNDTIQHAGIILGLWGIAGHAHRHYARDTAGYHNRAQCTQNISAVTAACLLVRKNIYEQVEGLNEEHLTIAFNDVDFCLKVHQAGYRNLWTPYAELYHHESISRGADNTFQKGERKWKEIEYMKVTWPELLSSDPYYNPNLTRRREDFSIYSDFHKE